MLGAKGCRCKHRFVNWTCTCTLNRQPVEGLSQQVMATQAAQQAAEAAASAHRTAVAHLHTTCVLPWLALPAKTCAAHRSCYWFTFMPS
jgi:hypothetical protein